MFPAVRLEEHSGPVVDNGTKVKVATAGCLWGSSPKIGGHRIYHPRYRRGCRGHGVEICFEKSFGHPLGFSAIIRATCHRRWRVLLGVCVFHEVVESVSGRMPGTQRSSSRNLSCETLFSIRALPFSCLRRRDSARECVAVGQSQKGFRCVRIHP